jgi:hypothetical protein
MAGLVPAIHAFPCRTQGVDARDKRGHDNQLESQGWKSGELAAGAGPSALARFETPLRLVDHVDATLAPNQAVVAMALAQRTERIADFHCADLWFRRGSTVLTKSSQTNLRRRRNEFQSDDTCDD